jgi:hypothetical protein
MQNGFTGKIWLGDFAHAYVGSYPDAYDAWATAHNIMHLIDVATGAFAHPTRVTAYKLRGPRDG